MVFVIGAALVSAQPPRCRSWNSVNRMPTWPVCFTLRSALLVLQKQPLVPLADVYLNAYNTGFVFSSPLRYHSVQLFLTHPMLSLPMTIAGHQKLPMQITGRFL